MTLRGVVLFPKAMMPLRIFEERYKKMLAERLEGIAFLPLLEKGKM